jgi:hypothetical protein
VCALVSEVRIRGLGRVMSSVGELVVLIQPLPVRGKRRDILRVSPTECECAWGTLILREMG